MPKHASKGRVDETCDAYLRVRFNKKVKSVRPFDEDYLYEGCEMRNHFPGLPKESLERILADAEAYDEETGLLSLRERETWPYRS